MLIFMQIYYCWEHWFLARLDLRQELMHIKFGTKHNKVDSDTLSQGRTNLQSLVK